MTWLTSLPVWALVIGCLSIALMVAFGGRAVAVALIAPREREEAHSSLPDR